ncbi:M56 family metallopeptidase [Aquimarina gracilis]|uniref:M56 family metallopeptidase n=1 Tax=Aquimarina gracilis TaxID=874422 RepID=A0ABU5ZT52_9FLAO|nr:M56 family metallopeptidase [Aquimarina gracilis]MEB3345190.1 M56 family metallopeptidase [Aquimarina gracilis]
MLHYILQILIFQVLFLALYDAFHKKDTFFNWNRLYLLITPILSLALPFIKIELFKNETSQVVVTQLERVITISSESLTVLGTTGTEESPTNWWLILYYIGLGVSLLLLILKLYKLKVLTSFSFISNINDKKVVTLPNSNQAFSFWNTIYLGDQLLEEEKKHILIHEIVHVQQKHSLDQIWFETFKILFWWNPMMYIYQSRITILHEYIADEAVTTTINKRNYIEQLLNSAFQTQEITFANQFFNQSLIKKRIVMLQKSKSKSIAKFKYLLLIPAIAGILTYTSCRQETNQSTNTNIENQENTKTSDIIPKYSSREPECSNKNSVYDMNLDNYLKVRSGKNAEVIVDVVSTETSKKVRTVYLLRNMTFYIRNIPEGKYQLHITYGDDYAEKTVNGECQVYFKNQKATEVSNEILDFNVLVTDKGRNVPSYNIKVDLVDSESSNEDDIVAKKGEKDHTHNSPIGDRSAEPECPNQKAKYDNKLDNYLRLTSGKNAEIIVEIVMLESSQSVRTIHIKRDQVYFVRNIPEGKYKLNLAYGDTYSEKMINGECKAYFKDEKATEINENVLDFTTITSDKGLSVPSYNMKLELEDSQTNS